MKFRARITDILAIKKLYNVISTMAKLAKSCVLRITHDKVYFILTDSGRSSLAVWCTMPRASYFSEFTMEGVTTQEPEIYLELEPDRLAKALNSLRTNLNTRALKIKLTRKHATPCLSFEIELNPSLGSMMTTNSSSLGSVTNTNSNSKLCIHDVPVTLIPRRQWADFRKPRIPPTDVSVYLPDLTQVKNMTEKYKNLGDHFTVEANKQGTMKLTLEADLVEVVTHFKHLDLPSEDEALNMSRLCGDEENEEPDRERVDEDTYVGVRVDLKKFHMSLSADQINPNRILANFVEGKMLHLFLMHEDVVIQYFIPGIVD